MFQPPRRHATERSDPHPVYGAFMNNKIAQAFQRDEVREKVIPAYMGLIKQCDDQLGRLLDHLEATGRMEDTMIVVTSDHGDYLGDHWLGEKDLFHEPSVKIPLIIYDPRREADATRGTTCDALVESIDLAATFVEAGGGTVPGHIIEGRSLMPWLHGETPENWRDFVISEYDYSVTPMRTALGVSADDARLFMVYDGRYKLIHAEGGFRPMLFDTLNPIRTSFSTSVANPGMRRCSRALREAGALGPPQRPAGDALRRGHRGDARRLCTQGHFAISRRWLGGSGGTDFEIPGTGTADPPGDGAGRS
jgi:arylsulfatase A-like enzyme